VTQKRFFSAAGLINKAQDPLPTVISGYIAHVLWDFILGTFAHGNRWSSMLKVILYIFFLVYSKYFTVHCSILCQFFFFNKLANISIYIFFCEDVVLSVHYWEIQLLFLILANGCNETKSEHFKDVWILSVPTVYFCVLTFACFYFVFSPTKPFVVHQNTERQILRVWKQTSH